MTRVPLRSLNTSNLFGKILGQKISFGIIKIGIIFKKDGSIPIVILVFFVPLAYYVKCEPPINRNSYYFLKLQLRNNTIIFSQPLKLLKRQIIFTVNKAIKTLYHVVAFRPMLNINYII